MHNRRPDQCGTGRSGRHVSGLTSARVPTYRHRPAAGGDWTGAAIQSPALSHMVSPHGFEPSRPVPTGQYGSAHQSERIRLRVLSSATAVSVSPPPGNGEAHTGFSGEPGGTRNSATTCGASLHCLTDAIGSAASPADSTGEWLTPDS